MYESGELVEMFEKAGVEVKLANPT
jgi:hypothetical protein